jgi:hypothetical protein
MTTGNGDTSTATARWSTQFGAALGGLTEEAAARLALIAGLVTLLGVTGGAELLLHNTYGPLGDHESAAKWAPLGVGAATGLVAVAVTQWVARRSAVAVVSLLAVAAVIGWALFPRAIDVSESWVPRPNERYACTGWEFRHYPPGTFDASATTYCIGLEHRIADG